MFDKIDRYMKISGIGEKKAWLMLSYQFIKFNIPEVIIIIRQPFDTEYKIYLEIIALNHLIHL